MNSVIELYSTYLDFTVVVFYFSLIVQYNFAWRSKIKSCTVHATHPTSRKLWHRRFSILYECMCVMESCNRLPQKNKLTFGNPYVSAVSLEKVLRNCANQDCRLKCLIKSKSHEVHAINEITVIALFKWW